MDEKDWQMLKTIAEVKNVTRAAERLFIAQSSLSYRLKNLEKEFNTKLLVRTPNGVIFTPEGEYVLQYARGMEQQLKKTKEHVQNMKGTHQGILRIAVSSVFAHYVLPDILKGFLEEYPAVEILLQTSSSTNVYRMLQKEEISIAIVRGDYLWTEVKHMLSEEPICLASATPLDICDLPNRPQIVHPSSAVRDMAEEWWRQTFTSPPYISMEVDNMDICRQMVLRGLGWGIIPGIGLKGYQALCAKELYWKNGNPLLRRTWLMYRNSSLELTVVRAFVDYLTKNNFE